MNWFEAWEHKNKLEKNPVKSREKTGEVKTSPRALRRVYSELLSRVGWKKNGRRVNVGDAQAMKTICNKATGHMLNLFAIDQTEEML